MSPVRTRGETPPHTPPPRRSAPRRAADGRRLTFQHSLLSPRHARAVGNLPRRGRTPPGFLHSLLSLGQPRTVGNLRLLNCDIRLTAPSGGFPMEEVS